MSQSITLKLPDDVDRALHIEAARSGKSLEEVALEWIGSHTEKLRCGSADALMSSHGAWSMTPDERTQIEQMIEEERLLEEDHQ